MRSWVRGASVIPDEEIGSGGWCLKGRVQINGACFHGGYLRKTPLEAVGGCNESGVYLRMPVKSISPVDIISSARENPTPTVTG